MIKYYTTFIFSLISLVSLSSCSNSVDGDKFTDIIFSQDTVSFDANGGTVIVKCLNTDTYFLNLIQDELTGVYVKQEYGDKPLPGEIMLDDIQVKGGENSKDVVITVSPSNEHHVWTIYIEYILYTGKITVNQGN